MDQAKKPEGMNFAPTEPMEMAVPREQGAPHVVGAGTPTKRRSGVFKLLVEQHVEAFALVKRLGTRPEGPLAQEQVCCAGAERQAHERHARERGEMVQVHAALRAVVEAALLQESDANASDLVNAVAALDAINPGSPEWDPTFLQLSELVEARINAEQSEFVAQLAESQELLAAG